MIRLFKHYIPHAVLMLGIFDFALLVAAAEAGWVLRAHQIDLIARLGVGLAKAVKMRGVLTLLKLSRGPAKATGLGELQGFLERGFAAFSALGDGKAFVRDIEQAEREASRRLFAGDPAPFG